MQTPSLRSSRWLAQRLGLSITTIERLRADGSADLPPSISIGKSIRYDENHVEQWLQDRARGPVPTSANMTTGRTAG